MRVAACLAACLLVGCTKSNPQGKPTKVDKKEEPRRLDQWTFDNDKPDTVPPGWDLGETGAAGTPAKWGVVKQDDAPSGTNAFGVLETKNGKPTFNVALAPFQAARDVDLSVMVKPVTGELDQGGGFVLRAKGTTDYYIVRWNPLEKNVKFYKVVAGHRDMIAKADTDVDPSKWHRLRVLADGNRFEIFFDDETVLELNDTTHPNGGRIGLWTKADAATLFDDFLATAL